MRFYLSMGAPVMENPGLPFYVLLLLCVLCGCSLALPRKGVSSTSLVHISKSLCLTEYTCVVASFEPHTPVLRVEVCGRSVG